MRILRFLGAALACAALGLSLAGCSSLPLSDPDPPLAGRSGNFEAGASIRYGGLEAEATVLQRSPSECTVTFAAPESLKGVTFVYGADSVDVRFLGLAFRFDPGAVPGGAVAEIMVKAVSKAVRNDGIAVSQTERGTELSGTLDAGPFTLYLDSGDGSLRKLLVPSVELEIEFVNFRFLD